MKRRSGSISKSRTSITIFRILFIFILVSHLPVVGSRRVSSAKEVSTRKAKVSPTINKANWSLPKAVKLKASDDQKKQSEKTTIRNIFKGNWILSNASIADEDVKRTFISFGKESFHIGFIVAFMKGLSPFIVTCTQHIGKHMASTVALVMNSPRAFLKSLSKGIKYLLFRKILNPNYPFFRLRKECKDKDFDGDSNENHYQPVVLTKTAQSVLFYFSAFVDFNNLAGKKKKFLSSDGLISLITSRYINRKKLVVIGALARGLQLCTGIEYAFDPSIGVSALINFGAAWADLLWVRSYVIGWTLSSELWKICGVNKARSPKRDDE